MVSFFLKALSFFFTINPIFKGPSVCFFNFLRLFILDSLTLCISMGASFLLCVGFSAVKEIEGQFLRKRGGIKVANGRASTKVIDEKISINGFQPIG